LTADVRTLGEGVLAVTLADSGGPLRTVEVRRTQEGYSWREGHSLRVARVEGEAPRVRVDLGHVALDADVQDARVAHLAALASRRPDAEGPLVVRTLIPGRVVKVVVAAGQSVTAGQPLAVIEAMKMENELRAPRAGTITRVAVAEGAAVEAGGEIAVIG
jgi:biotin carboxyl carrier protein